MRRYKLKIERKYNESYVNHTFKFPRVEEKKAEQIDKDDILLRSRQGTKSV